MEYRPWLSLIATRWPSISAGLAAVTVTPGSTPPVLSDTVPEMPCANAAAGASRSTPTTTHVRRERETVFKTRSPSLSQPYPRARLPARAPWGAGVRNTPPRCLRLFGCQRHLIAAFGTTSSRLPPRLSQRTANVIRLVVHEAGHRGPLGSATLRSRWSFAGARAPMARAPAPTTPARPRTAR